MTCQQLVRAGVVTAALPAVIGFAAVPAHATTTISVNCAHHSLQHAINTAHTGGTVLVNGHCVGTFTIAKNLTIKGNPRATLDADHKGSVITVDGARRVTLSAIVVTRGTAGTGGGIYLPDGGGLRLQHVSIIHDAATNGAGGGIAAAHGAKLRIDHSVVSDNSARTATATASLANAAGGGIEGTGPISIVDSTMSNDLVDGRSAAGTAGLGGAIFSTATLSIVGCTFGKDRAESTAVASVGVDSNSASGGALAWEPSGSASLTITGSMFNADEAVGHNHYYTNARGGTLFLDPGSGTHAARIVSSTISKSAVDLSSVNKGITLSGGAIEGIADGTTLNLSLIGTTIEDSKVVGTAPGEVDAAGGGIFLDGASLSMSHSVVRGNSTSASTSGAGGVDERGGGVDAENIPAPLVVYASTIGANSLTGTSTGSGGVSLSGAGLVATGSAPVVVRRSQITANKEIISGTDGASAEYGPGLDLGSAATDQVVNSTIAQNELTASGFGPSGTLSIGGGGIAAFDTALQIRFSTISDNGAAMAGPGGGGGIYIDPGSAVTIDGSILAKNDADSGTECYGSITSGGYNVHSSDMSDCSWAAGPGDLTANPKVGDLADHGGPTQTIPLLSGSPAVDHVPVSHCDGLTVDQRGVKRPQGARCDVGAFERK